MSVSENSDSDSSEEVTTKNSLKSKQKNKDTKKRVTKRGAKEEPETKKVKLELEKPELKDLNFECGKTTKDGEKWNLKITSWNVAGLRAWLKVSVFKYCCNFIACVHLH